MRKQRVSGRVSGKDAKPQDSGASVSLGHLVKVFLIYLAFSAGFMGWMEYISYDAFNPIWVLVAALVLALVGTASHRYVVRRNRVDELADKEF